PAELIARFRAWGVPAAASLAAVAGDGEVTEVLSRRAGRGGGALKVILLRYQPQRGVPAFAARARSRTGACDGFGVQSAHNRPDCQPESAGSSASSKLNSASTAGWQ